jgi:hypothetical protein
MNLYTLARTAAVAAVALLAVPAGTASRAAPIAYVGCSISSQSVYGYTLSGGGDLWSAAAFNGKGRLGMYPGGTLAMWDRTLTDDVGGLLPYWRQFDAMNAARPGAQRVWLQVCVLKPETVAQSIASGERVLAEIHRRLPGAVVYASAMSDYTARPEQVDVDAAVAVAHDLVARGLALAGPDMPRLNARQLLPDRVHMNVLGERAAGRTLVGFFGTAMQR